MLGYTPRTMDRAVLERMIGAAVLVALLVIAAPAILDGQRDPERSSTSLALPDAEDGRAVRTVRLTPNTAPGVTEDASGSATSPTEYAGAPPRSASPPRPTVETARPASAWTVQLGSFASRQNAEQLTSQVNAGGWEADMSQTRSGGRTLYRVRVAAEGDRETAARLAAALAEAGFPGQVIEAD